MAKKKTKKKTKKKSTKKPKKTKGELTDEDLEGVAGGTLPQRPFSGFKSGGGETRG